MGIKYRLLMIFATEEKDSYDLALYEMKSVLEAHHISYEIVSVLGKRTLVWAPLHSSYILLWRMSLLREVYALFDTPDEAFEFLINLGVKRVNSPDFSLPKDFIADLSESEAEIRKIRIDGEEFSAVLLGRGRRHILARDPRYRPYAPPYTMNSKLSRLAVNLSRAVPGEIFLDPFCGSGSIALEASKIGCTTICLDINFRDLYACMSNFSYFRSPTPILIAGDATRIPLEDNAVSAIATDPPYGRSSKAVGGLKRLYEEFLIEAARVLKKGSYLAMFYPSTMDFFDRIVANAGFSISFRRLLKVHGGLSRYVVALRLS